MGIGYRRHLFAVVVVGGIGHRRASVSNPRRGRMSRNRRSCTSR